MFSDDSTLNYANTAAYAVSDISFYQGMKATDLGFVEQQQQLHRSPVIRMALSVKFSIRGQTIRLFAAIDIQ